MSMASLSADLLTRQAQREVRRHGRTLTSSPAIPVVATVTRPVTLPTPQLQRPAPKPDRQRKTLRLDRETHRALKRLAKQKGVSQQSLMERAVSRMLKNENALHTNTNKA